MDLTPNIKDLLRGAALHQDSVIMGVYHGGKRPLKILTKGWKSNNLRPKPIKCKQFLQNALKSDNTETVEAILAFVCDVSFNRKLDKRESRCGQTNRSG